MFDPHPNPTKCPWLLIPPGVVAHLASSPVSYISQDRETFSFPSVSLTAKLQEDALGNVGLPVRSLLSHVPGSNQISSKEGWINNAGTQETHTSKPKHDGKGQWKGKNGAASFLLKKGKRQGIKRLSWEWEGGRTLFICSEQELIHSFTQEGFIEHLLCVSHHAGVKEILKSKSMALFRRDHRLVRETVL